MTLAQKIKEHLSLLGKALNLTQLISDKIDREEVNEVYELSDNRERLVQVIIHLFHQIDRDLNHLATEEITPKLIQELKLWQDQMNTLVNAINELDEKIVLTLELEKNKTSGEIAQLFKSKESLKGYDLTTVKK
jgi:hypothetical protein